MEHIQYCVYVRELRFGNGSNGNPDPGEIVLSMWGVSYSVGQCWEVEALRRELT